jgi:focal adhesion kinase 1
MNNCDFLLHPNRNVVELDRHSSRSSDYAEISDLSPSPNCVKNFEIDRTSLELAGLIGVGQFGDVFKGIYKNRNGRSQMVAVKTCKLEMEAETAEKLLAEAYIMEQFDHPHITKLIGVCSDSPVLIVMELAEIGEMRHFLHENTDRLSTLQLIVYCHQLSTALSYLESKHFVHRDIAARNVLVSSFDCVKLSDFGLSRWLQDSNYYTGEYFDIFMNI